LCNFFIFYFFFFQAEDGIRDKLVTGVQTCALPIYRFFRNVRALGVSSNNDEKGKKTETCEYASVHGFTLHTAPLHGIGSQTGDRSEERRVGKESRGRG